jgi:tetratricopeptide (TPR) repeat protein
LFIAGITAILYMAGCNNPRRSDAHLLVTQADMQMAQGEGFLMPDAAEADYVENAVAARQAYRDALTSLADYYSSVGNATKLQWARTELKTFDQMVHYRYLQPAEWVPQNRMAMNSIEEADIMYDEGMKLYRQAGGFLIITSQAKLRQALGVFNDLIQQYPSSDKIDDAAYRAALIYEHLDNYELAAVYYQRTFQWNEVTPYPARFRAAKVMDQKLKMRKEALALYKLAVQKESRYVENVEYAQMRINALSAPDMEMLGDEGEMPYEEPMQ